MKAWIKLYNIFHHSIRHKIVCTQYEFILFSSYYSRMASQFIKRTIDHDHIIKSAGDKRIYQGLELNNGMKLLLISDPETDKASAAMDINIGRCLNSNWILSILYIVDILFTVIGLSVMFIGSNLLSSIHLVANLIHKCNITFVTL